MRVLVVLLLLLLAGCLVQTGGEKNDSTPVDLSTNASVSGIAVLPVAYSDQTYTTTITPSGGVAPYTCVLVGSNSIGGTLSLSRECVISGTAPFVSEDTIFPFKVNITEANGAWTVVSATLTVRGSFIEFTLPDRLDPPAPKGTYQSYDLCNPPGQINCGKDANQVSPVGGNPPYTFTVRGQPMGYIMNLNGVLGGTLSPMPSHESYDLEVCVKDLSGTRKCASTVLPVAEDEEEEEPEPEPEEDEEDEEEEEEPEEEPEPEGENCSRYMGIWEGSFEGIFSNTDGDSVMHSFDLRIEVSCTASKVWSETSDEEDEAESLLHPDVLEATSDWDAFDCFDLCVPMEPVPYGQDSRERAWAFLDPENRDLGYMELRFADPAGVVNYPYPDEPRDYIDLWMSFTISDDDKMLTSRGIGWTVNRGSLFVCPASLDPSQYCKDYQNYGQYEGGTHDCCTLDSSTFVMNKVG